METLSLAEKILLLHYDNETGARGGVGKDARAFIRALELAVVFELVVEGRLRVTGSGKETNAYAAAGTDGGSGKPVLDHVYRKIAAVQKGSEPINLYGWVSENRILGDFNEGMGIVYQRLLDEKIIELRDMNRSLTTSSSIARVRGEAIALSKRVAWGVRKIIETWFGDAGKKTAGQSPESPASDGKGNGSLAKQGFGTALEQYRLEVLKPQFQGDHYVIRHPFPGERGEIKLSLRRRLNNAVVSFVQLASVPQDPDVDRAIHKNSSPKIITDDKNGGRKCGGADFLGGILELKGTMVPADIATIAAITQAAKIPNALFPVNKKIKGDVLAAASEDLTAQKEAFSLMGECARGYFSQDARQVLALVG